MAGPFYKPFVSLRLTEPDYSTLIANLKALDASVGVSHLFGTNAYTLKKATDWTPGQIAAAQNVLDTSPATSPQLSAQSTIDNWPIELKALVLALIDQLNVIRAALPVPLAPITPAQALAAVRAKAGTL